MAGSTIDQTTSKIDTTQLLKSLGLENFAQNLASEIGKHLSEIAALFGLSPQDFANANPGLKTDQQGNVANGQKISTGTGANAPSAYTVKSGDNLTRIAERTGVSLAALIAANPQIANPNRIRPGDVLSVPSGATAPATRTGTQTAAAQTTAGQTTAGQNGGTYTPNAAALRTADMAQSMAGGRSQGRCYAWVKDALLKSGAVKDFIPGVAAKGAGPELEKRGYVNILNQPGSKIKSAYDAPPGAVLVYGAASSATDKNAKYGHIEVRTRNGFASDYSSTTARTGTAANGLEGRGRVLIGVYIKPGQYTQSGGTTAATATPGSQSPAGATSQFASASGGGGVSAAGMNKLYDREAVPGVSNHLHWPKYASGVTLGAGYDMKEKSRATVIKDLTAIGISRSAAETAANGVGLKGQAAKDFAAANKNLINLTPTQEKALLKNEIKAFEKVVTDNVKVKLTQNQYDALVSFAFNIGEKGFTTSTTLRKLNQGDYAGAGEAMKLFNKSGPNVVQGLINRRNSEVQQFNSASAPMQATMQNLQLQSGQTASRTTATGNAIPVSANTARSTADYVSLIRSNGDAQATRDLDGGKKVVLAVRNDTNSKANGGRGVYDDQMVVVWKDAAGNFQSRTFTGNTDPSAQYAYNGPKADRGSHTDMNGDGKADLGRLQAGSYRFAQQQNYLGNTAFRATRTQTAERDTNQDGVFDARDRNRIDRSGAGTSMLIHTGGSSNTYSAGCQTMAPAEYNRFLNSLGGQSSFSYVLVQGGAQARPATATAQAGATPSTSATGRLGDLSMICETGKSPGQYRTAAGIVSSGIGDKGGKSYGAYQLASKMGQPQEFLQNDGARWASEFSGMDPKKAGSFEAKWKEIAKREPDAFFNAQHDFIKRTHYDPVVASVKAATGVDVNTMSPAVQNAVWSMSVQHGKAAMLVTDSIKSTQVAGTTNVSSAVINALYDRREAYARAIGQPNLIERYTAERAAALKM